MLLMMRLFDAPGLGTSHIKIIGCLTKVGGDGSHDIHEALSMEASRSGRVQGLEKQPCEGKEVVGY